MTLHSADELMRQLDVANAAPPAPSLHRPRKPSAVVPDFLHRGTDGWVPLARKVGEEWQELGSVPAGQLRGLFSDQVMAEAMQADSYFGLHAMYRPGRYRHRTTLPGLQPSARNVDSVRWLTCCGVDLDAYKQGMDTHGIVAAVMRLVDEGTLPPPSVFTLSRGVWALWRLHDKQNPGEPIRSYPASVMSRWCKVQSALHNVCATLGSDTATRHAATVTRIPGSVNSKNGRRVGYMLPADIHGQPFSYTLDELESFLRPHLPAPVVVDAVPRQKSQNKALSRRALKGWHGRWHNLRKLLGQLRDMRGGWKVGTRSAALFYVAMSLRALDADEREVRRVMAQHMENMEQPAGDRLKPADARRIYTGMKKPRSGGANHQTVADALDVSPDEAALLSADRRKLFPPARRHRVLVLPATPTLARGEAQERRQEAVRGIVERLKGQGIEPTGPDVQAHLLAEGFTAARATVLSDMQAVGCPSVRAHKGKAPKAVPDTQAQLF